ncbi:unnamed protein product [Ilex paraguariensis]|uniref:Uncharacterized protein n=1 Tax=Ilex paraguariensis TaxID=185542 RepID=A0ABC8TU42_9AQUA
MTESVIDMDQKEKLVDRREEEDEEKENGDNGPSSSENTSFLTELNLILLLSFLSLSSEECYDSEEVKETENIKDHKVVQTASRSQTRRQNVKEFKALDRQAPRLQTKIRDCRHNRRM